MNSYIMAQCQTMMKQVQLFKQACEMAALKDDGTIDKDEQKALKQINKACEGFIRDIQKLV